MQNISTNNDAPLVVIRCITYNHEPYIRQCLEGFVMQQTNFKFVAVVVDDASTDRNAEIIKEFEEKYPEIIKPVYLKENHYSQGKKKSVYFEKWLKQAKYTAYCEGDDYWTDPLKLQKQVDFLEANEEYGMCYTDVNVYYEESKKYDYSIFESKKSIISNEFPLDSDGYLGNMTWLYRVELYNEIFQIKRRNNMIDGAYFMFLEMAVRTKMKFIPDVTAVYRKHQGSVSNPLTNIGKYKFFKDILLIRYEFCQKYVSDIFMQSKYISSHMLYILPLAIKYGDEECKNMIIDFFNKLYVDSSALIEFAKHYYDAEMIYKSKTYRIGNFICLPFRFLRSLFKKN